MTVWDKLWENKPSDRFDNDYLEWRKKVKAEGDSMRDEIGYQKTIYKAHLEMIVEKNKELDKLGLLAVERGEWNIKLLRQREAILKVYSRCNCLDSDEYAKIKEVLGE